MSPIVHPRVDELRIPLAPVTCSGRTLPLVPEEPIIRIGAQRRERSGLVSEF